MALVINRPVRQVSPVEAKRTSKAKNNIKKLGLQTQAMLAIYLQKQLRPANKTKK